MIKLACPDFTWPLMPHTTALDLIRSLDFSAVVLGLFGNRSHIRPEVVREDVPKWAGILGERTARAGLDVADLFVQAWTDVETMAVNNPDPQQRADGDAFFLDMLELGPPAGLTGHNDASGRSALATRGGMIRSSGRRRV